MKRSILFVVISFIMIFYIRWNCSAFYMPGTFLMHTDSRMSSSFVSFLHDYLHECAQQKRVLQDVVNECKKKYPCIKEISICYKPARSMVCVCAHNPLCILNEEHIVLDSGEIVEKNIFASAENEFLPAIRVSDACMDNTAHFIQKLLLLLPRSTYANYSVEVNDKNYIALTDKHNQQFSILCSVDQPISPDLFNHCHIVKKNIFMKSAMLEAKAKWIADTRFADYIVAYKV